MKRFLQLFFFVLVANAACATDSQSKPLPPPPEGIDRHYFEKADDAACALIEKGLTREVVRTRCKGQEFPPFETIRGEYFVVAVDYERSGFFDVPNFRPQPKDPVDFFFTGKSLLLVYYDKDEVVVHTVYWGPRPNTEETADEREPNQPPQQKEKGSGLNNCD